MEAFLQRRRGPLAAAVTTAFLSFLLWSAHTPGEPRTVRDFLYLISLCGVPFLVFIYACWSLTGSSEIRAGIAGAELSKRCRLALIGAILGATSAALLLLVLPLWPALIEHGAFGTVWTITGILLTAIATTFGIIGSTKLRWSAMLSIFLLPFWLFAAALLAKSVMD